MKILILGGDGYLGWPTAMHLSAQGHQVAVVDNYLRRSLCREENVEPLWKDIYSTQTPINVNFFNTGVVAETKTILKLLKNAKKHVS